MNKERLLYLADALEADAANPTGMKFDLGTWVQIEDHVGSPERSCGTVGCAVGLATMLPEFNKQGLINIPWDGFGNGYFKPYFEGAWSWKAVTRFFDIKTGQAEYLFSFYSYDDSPIKGADGELAVAKRIREFVANEGKF